MIFIKNYKTNGAEGNKELEMRNGGEYNGG
jgi:hypothetical protein